MDDDPPHYSFCINDLPVMSKNESILFNLSSHCWEDITIRPTNLGYGRLHVYKFRIRVSQENIFSSKPVLWIYLTLNPSRKWTLAFSNSLWNNISNRLEHKTTGNINGTIFIPYIGLKTSCWGKFILSEAYLLLGVKHITNRWINDLSNISRILCLIK